MKYIFVLILFFIIFITSLFSQTVIQLRKNNNSDIVSCKVNDFPIDFIFDTGADYVVIPMQIAKSLFQFGNFKESDYKDSISTIVANGKIVKGRVINIKKIEIGNLSFFNIKAIILDAPGAFPLLGKTVINKFGKYSIHQDRLTIDTTFNDNSFNEKIETFIDKRDGNNYSWIKINNQIWMAENLNYKTDSCSWCYDNKKVNCKKYGRLYNWTTAIKICPKGWHLPSKNDWGELITFLDENNAGSKLKQGGISGFEALTGGFTSRKRFDYMGQTGLWWTSTIQDANNTNAWTFEFYNAGSGIGFSLNNIGKVGVSVRCLKD